MENYSWRVQAGVPVNCSSPNAQLVLFKKLMVWFCTFSSLCDLYWEDIFPCKRLFFEYRTTRQKSQPSDSELVRTRWPRKIYFIQSKSMQWSFSKLNFYEGHFSSQWRGFVACMKGTVSQMIFSHNPFFAQVEGAPWCHQYGKQWGIHLDDRAIEESAHLNWPRHCGIGRHCRYPTCPI